MALSRVTKRPLQVGTIAVCSWAQLMCTDLLSSCNNISHCLSSY